MTPCEERGYKIGMLFVTMGRGGGVPEGLVIKLNEDNGTVVPIFARVEKDADGRELTYWLHLDEVAPIVQPTTAATGESTTYDHMLEIIQAAKEGKELQWKYRGPDGGWNSCAIPPVEFNFAHLEYRLKPEPARFYRNLYADGWSKFVRNTPEGARQSAGKSALRTAVEFVEVVKD